MPDRTWFYASDGKQLGPFPEHQLREFIARGMVTAETLVWTEGMSGWQRAGDIAELSPVTSGPPAFPHQDGSLTAYPGGHGGGSLSTDLPLWTFFGQSLLLMVGYLLVVPAPWTGTGFYRWLVSQIEVPDRPNLAFTGQPGDIWYVFVATGLMYYVGALDNTLQLISIPVSAFLSWVLVRWLAGNLSSNGQRLPIAFNGDAVTFVGWQLLMYISVLTIIGWAWVIAAWMRWVCRNISGTRREVIFNGTGSEILWRTIVFTIGLIFLIPIPWVMRWYFRWYVSQFALIERGT
jgi:GYF domain 2